MIKIENISKSFDTKKILSNINIEIPKGSRHCIIGRSGSGKSVLIKLITGLLKPDTGQIIFEGIDIAKANQDEIYDLRKRVGFVFQNAALFDSYNVYENTVLALYEHGERDEKELEKRSITVLSSVGLLPPMSEINTPHFKKEWESLKTKKPSDLSGGMRKRVAVARALITNPEYIFYDEPTTGLDPVTSEQIDKLILKLDNKLDVTSVYRIAEQVTFLENTAVHFSGTPDELKNSDDAFVKKFVERFE